MAVKKFPSASAHIHCGQIEIQYRFLFLEVRLVQFPHADHLTHDLGVKAGALGLGKDLSNIGAQRFAFLIQPLDTVDEGFQLVFGESGFGHTNTRVLKKRRTLACPREAAQRVNQAWLCTLFMAPPLAARSFNAASSIGLSRNAKPCALASSAIKSCRNSISTCGRLRRVPW